MNLVLQRVAYRSDGIFSTLIGMGQIAVTLEHSYVVDGLWRPKIPAGMYTCVRGTHQLEHGGPFETFEITGVANHSGLLFHSGNLNADSSGCVLVGTSILKDSAWEIIDSRIAFENFMDLESDVDEFVLTVKA